MATTDRLDPAHIAALWNTLQEAGEADEHDALGGFLVVAGLGEICSSRGVEDAVECNLVRHVAGSRFELTALGHELAAWCCADHAKCTREQLDEILASFSPADRDVYWGHWGITFHAGPMQPGGYRQYTLGEFYFPVGAQGPCDGTLGSPEHERHKAICRDWRERGILPERLNPPGNWQRPICHALWAHALAEQTAEVERG